MPGAAVTTFFLDNEDWSPVGIPVVVTHRVCVLSGVDVEVVPVTVSIQVKSGNDVEIS